MMLYKIIARKEREHAELFDKIEKGGIDSFKNASFEDRMYFIKLKNDLAHLHFIAAMLAKKYNCKISQGSHIRNVLAYNPYLMPDLVRNLEHRHSLLPELDTNQIIEAVISTSAYVGGELLSIPSSILFLYGGMLIPFFYEHTIERGVHTAYVLTECLKDIPDILSVDEYLSRSMAHLHDGNHYLAIRYILEADVRSQVELPVCMHIFNHCINYLLDGDEANEKRKIYFLEHHDMISHMASQGTTKDTIENNLNRIRAKVLESKEITEQKARLLDRNRFKHIWDASLDKWDYKPSYSGGPGLKSEYSYFRNSFTEKICGLLGRECENYHITIPEIVRNLRNKWPYYSSENDRQLTSTIPVIELIAYMTQITRVPPIYLKMAITSNAFTGNHSDAEEYLYSLLTPQEGTELITSVAAARYSKESFLLKKENGYVELLALLVTEKNHTDCELLQTSNVGKYWLALHGTLAQEMDISSLPPHLKNPLVYMQNYVDKHFLKSSSQAVFMKELLADGIDMQMKLNKRTRFSTRLSFQTKRKAFFNMLENLAQLGPERLNTFYESCKENNPNLQAQHQFYGSINGEPEPGELISSINDEVIPKVLYGSINI